MRRELTPINYVELCFAPVLFVHGAEDTFITPQHSQDLYVSLGQGGGGKGEDDGTLIRRDGMGPL